MEKSIDYKKLGQRIKFYRLKKGLTQSQLAEFTNLSPSSISYIENATSSQGKQRKISLNSLVKVSNELNVTPNDLLCDSLDGIVAIHISKDIEELLKECNSQELVLIKNVIIAVKNTLKEQK